MSAWHYQGKVFPTLETDLAPWFGFVYLIEDTTNGQKYIGRKYLTKAATKQVKGKRKKIRKESNWLEYWGSNALLLDSIKQKGPESFSRTILHLCRTKAECAYWESYEIFTRNALISDEFYNQWISCRIRKANLQNLWYTVK